jgi:hypothetical protein
MKSIRTAKRTQDVGFCVNATAGNHILEVYFVSKSSMETTSWTFNNNGGQWMNFTQYNLNEYKYLAQIRGDTVVEFGTVSVDQPKKDLWYRVGIQNKFNNPVVVMGPPSFNGGHPLTIRVKNVTRTSFTFQFQEWTYLDFLHAKESISYMIVEEGVHQLSDGTFIEAGKVMVYNKWLKVDFEAEFKRAPNVFSQITSQYKTKPYNTRQRYITDNGF